MNRRKLLAGVPIIATLPCGAALATASTNACMVQAIDRTERGMVHPVDVREDEYVRVAAIRRTSEQGDVWYKVGDVWYSPDGMVGMVGEGVDVDVWVAVAYRYDEDMGGYSEVAIRFNGFETGTTALTGSCLASIVNG